MSSNTSTNRQEASQGQPEDPNQIFFMPLGAPDGPDHLKIREQARDFINKRHSLSLEKYAAYTHEERAKAREYSKEYGQTFLRTVFLLNGGAILTLLTLLGSLFGKNDHTILLVGISL